MAAHVIMFLTSLFQDSLHMWKERVGLFCVPQRTDLEPVIEMLVPCVVSGSIFSSI